MAAAWRALLLAALGLLPFRWLSPLSALNREAIFSDVLFALAFACWLIDRRRRLRRPALSPLHWSLVAFVALALVSTLANYGGAGASIADFLLIAELAAVGLITWDLAADERGRRLVSAVVGVDVIVVAGLAIAGVLLYYAGTHTALLDGYGALTPSSNYARVRAGFLSGPLLGSWCIFAAAVVATGPRFGWSPRYVRLLELALAVSVVLSISRAIIGFAAAWLIRNAPRRVAVAGVTVAVGIMIALSVGELHVDPTSPGAATYTIASARRTYATTSFTALVRRPLTGLGPSALPGRYYGKHLRAHLTPLGIAATLGLPAFCVAVFALAMLWRRRMRPTDVALWSGLIGIAIDGLGQDVEHFRHVWILLGLLAAGSAWRATASEDRMRNAAISAPP